jgi:hypothetical protein
MKLRYFMIFAVIFTYSFFSYSQVTCQSVGIASCVAEDMCVDFVDMANGDLDLWEGMCDGLEGEFFEDRPCDRRNVSMTCLNENNPAMPLLHFSNDFDRSEARMMCRMMGGIVCPQR